MQFQRGKLTAHSCTCLGLGPDAGRLRLRDSVPIAQLEMLWGTALHKGMRRSGRSCMQALACPAQRPSCAPARWPCSPPLASTPRSWCAHGLSYPAGHSQACHAACLHACWPRRLFVLEYWLLQLRSLPADAPAPSPLLMHRQDVMSCKAAHRQDVMCSLAGHRSSLSSSSLQLGLVHGFPIRRCMFEMVHTPGQGTAALMLLAGVKASQLVSGQRH